jgi:hypothetical protein
MEIDEKSSASSAHALSEITAAHKLRMLARNKKDLAKSLPREMLRFGHHFIDGKCDAKDRIIPRETAILTIVDAFVGKISGAKSRMVRPKFCNVSAREVCAIASSSDRISRQSDARSARSAPIFSEQGCPVSR